MLLQFHLMMLVLPTHPFIFIPIKKLVQRLLSMDMWVLSHKNCLYACTQHVSLDQLCDRQGVNVNWRFLTWEIIQTVIATASLFSLFFPLLFYVHSRQLWARHLPRTVLIVSLVHAPTGANNNVSCSWVRGEGLVLVLPQALEFK